jgi:serine protease Do
VTRGWLGVSIQELNEELKEYYGVDHGVLVVNVFPGDPAERAGIKLNDIILSINGQNVDSTHDLSKIISDLSVGEKARVAIYRDGDTKTVTVEIAKRDEKALINGGTVPKDNESELLGMTLSKITPQLAEKLNIQPDEGVIVVDIKSGSKVDKAGVEVNDLISEINHKPIRSVEEFREIINHIDEGGKIQFLIKRPRSGLVAITLTK